MSQGTRSKVSLNLNSKSALSASRKDDYDDDDDQPTCSSSPVLSSF